MSEKKQKKGRKNKYETHVKPRLHDIFSWKQQGWYEEDIYKALGVSKATWTKYKKEYKELAEVVLKGDTAIGHVAERSLYDALQWQEVVEKKEYYVIAKDGSQSKKIEKITKQVPPNITAIIFALKNKLPQFYYDRMPVEEVDKEEQTLIDWKEVVKEAEQMLNDKEVKGKNDEKERTRNDVEDLEK